MMKKRCWLSWMTRMWSFRVPTGPQQSTLRCRRQCSAQQTFASTQGRRRSGTQQGSNQDVTCCSALPRLTIPQRWCGEDPSCPHAPTRVERVGHASGPPFVRTSLEMKNIGHNVPLWKTCKIFGCCRSIVQLHEPTT